MERWRRRSLSLRTPISRSRCWSTHSRMERPCLTARQRNRSRSHPSRSWRRPGRSSRGLRECRVFGGWRFRDQGSEVSYQSWGVPSGTPFFCAKPSRQAVGRVVIHLTLTVPNVALIQLGRAGVAVSTRNLTGAVSFRTAPVVRLAIPSPRGACHYLERGRYGRRREEFCSRGSRRVARLIVHVGQDCGEQGISAFDGHEERVRRARVRFLCCLLLCLASAGGVCARVDVEEGDRSGQSRVFVRSVAVLCGVADRVAVHEGRKQLRSPGERHC